MKPGLDIAVCPSNESLRPIAQQLSVTLGLPLHSDPERDPASSAAQPTFVLLVLPRETDDYQVALQQTGSRERPLSVQFDEGALAHRRKYGGGRKQPLARAVGIKPGFFPSIVDATAGLARDAFVLACLGCRVTMLERSPIISALVEDGLRRAKQNVETAAIIHDKLQLITGNAIQLLGTLYEQDRQVIYIDPMYPQRLKSALVKKEMRLVRAVVGDDDDTSQLLSAAIQHAQRRVVVKRPRLADPLVGPVPSLSIESKNTRYDIYLRTTKE